LKDCGSAYYSVNHSGENYDIAKSPEDNWDSTIAINLSTMFY
jgi:hypothetical protein